MSSTSSTCTFCAMEIQPFCGGNHFGCLTYTHVLTHTIVGRALCGNKIATRRHTPEGGKQVKVHVLYRPSDVSNDVHTLGISPGHGPGCAQSHRWSAYS